MIRLTPPYAPHVLFSSPLGIRFTGLADLAVLLSLDFCAYCVLCLKDPLPDVHLTSSLGTF